MFVNDDEIAPLARQTATLVVHLLDKDTLKELAREQNWKTFRFEEWVSLCAVKLEEIFRWDVDKSVRARVLDANSFFKTTSLGLNNLQPFLLSQWKKEGLDVARCPRLSVCISSEQLANGWKRKIV